MKRNLVLFCFLAFNFAQSKAAVYKVDPSHSEVGFKIKHLVVSSVKGRFDKFDASFDFDEKTGMLKDVQAKIDIDSINTNETKRDEHLKGPDFFGARTKEGQLVEEKRWMTFKSTKVENKTNKPSKVHGQLTFNGVTKDVVLEVTYNGSVKDPWGNQKAGFSAETKVKRKDFGLTFNKTLDNGGLMLGEEVTVAIEGEAAMEKISK